MRTPGFILPLYMKYELLRLVPALFCNTDDARVCVCVWGGGGGHLKELLNV
jgi:hypothetical protein